MSSANVKVDNETPDSQKSRLPKQKVTAIGRLKTFGSTFKRRKIPPPTVFPPPSWNLDDEIIHRSSHLNASGPHVDSDHVPHPPPPPPDLPEPVTFAKKLQSLIESATKDQSAEARSLEGASKETGNSNGLSREPVPPGLDNNLVRMLASEDVMNGGHTTSTAGQAQKKRDNIWNILASLKTDAAGRTVEDEGGLMMYAPLEPQADSQVELAVPPPEVVDSVIQPEVPSSTRPQQPKKEIVDKRARSIPSTTELSVLTAWWGYRMYLPPSVMAKLDNKAIKATARAAMVATALKWLLEKIPIAIIPPQFRPAVKLLKQLTPLTGYIGVFVAWSWDRVRSLDEGNGVVLTATWLLPVALLPMAWDAGAIYRPILPPNPEELKKMAEAAAKAAEEDRKAAEKANKHASLGQKNQEGERKKSWFRW